MALEDKRLDDVTVYQLEILHVDSIMRLAPFLPEAEHSGLWLVRVLPVQVELEEEGWII